ncbi:MAG: zf-HC2 domain-containing protein [Actinomycetota bacterium]
MICSQVQALLSARLDGEHLPQRQVDAVEAHATGCPACTSFVEASRRARVAVRIRPAERVPDLVAPIMEAIELDRVRAPMHARHRLPSRAGPRPPVRVRALVAAALVSALVGSLVVGGPWRPPDEGPVAAAAIVQGVRGAAPSLDAFRATYTIVERGLAPDVPVRSLDMDVAFLAPQRFRLQIRDRTDYPTSAWTPTDIVYVEDMPASSLSGPTGCPADVAGCLPTRDTVNASSIYSAAAPLPADLILPLATFGSARGVRVIGTEQIDGRAAVHVEMSFARAAPLFPFLRLGGTWRPFFAGDLVQVWLDADGWFPLRITVSPSSDPERRLWEMRFGRAPESTDAPILIVRAVGFDASPPDPSLFAIPGMDGAQTLSLAELVDRTGFLPVTPTALGELTLSTVVVPPEGLATPRSLLVYTEGLDYLRIAELPAWSGPGPFGPVDALAEEVELPGVGVGFYEPAGEGLGRRISINGAETALFLETSLPRERLVAVAASLPIVGLPMPRSWRVTTSGDVSIARVGVDFALAAAGLEGLPGDLPGGYVVASARIERTEGVLTAVTLQLRQREVDAAGPPLTLHVEPGAGLPPPSSAGQVLVRSGPFDGRWSPGSSQLEWVQAGAYRSLQGPVDLPAMAAVAVAIAEVGSS